MSNFRSDDTSAHVTPDPPVAGWNGVFKTVRQSDVSKVEDCKDDIDTLLVFAGLYSAVLTTFIVESYKNLQQDPQDVMVFLMTQTFSQSYTFSGGYLNATSPPPSIPPFEAPLWAVRVNVLWFSSLILSLASSSLGILVKQWLREYLAFDYTSAEQCLRARQYRAPALKQWHVFEIASALPIILQISLALFLLGLCIFTNAVHESIGRTSVPIVSAWVFFFFITTIAPLFSPRCPFKTTFLKAAMKLSRRIVVPNTRRLLQMASRCVSWALTSTRARRGNLGKARSNLDADMYVLSEEDEVVNQEGGDAEVFWSVDASMVDDSLLLSMLAILQEQRQTSPLAMVEFAWRVIGHRNAFMEVVGARPSPLTMSEQLVLSHRTWDSLFRAVSNAFVGLVKNMSDKRDSLWVERAASFLLSNIQRSFDPNSDPRWIQAFFSHNRNVQHLAPEMLRPHLFSATISARQRLANRLYDILSSGVDAPLCPLCVIETFKLLLRPSSDSVYGDLLTLLSASQEDFAVRVIPQLDLVRPLSNLLACNDVRWITTPDLDRPREVEDLLVMVGYSGVGEDSRATIALGSAMMLGGPKLMYNYLCGYAALRPSHRIPLPKAERYKFKDAFQTCSPVERSHVLGSAIELCRLYCDGAFSQPREHPNLDFLRICQLFLETQGESRSASAPTDGLSLEWHRFWESCSRALGRYFELCKDRPSEDTSIAVKCMDTVSRRSIDVAGAPRQEQFSHPDELISTLARFIGDKRRNMSPRTGDIRDHDNAYAGGSRYMGAVNVAPTFTGEGYESVLDSGLTEEELSTDDDESTGRDSEGT